MTERTNPIIKLFNFVIANTEDNERAILFAHNGARFDNLIVLKLASETYGMDGFREVNAGPNNDIMLSLDITYMYKKKRHDVGFLKKVISFRDSYKLLDCSAANIPANYGTTSFKLPYCYNFYNEMFKIAYDDELDARAKKYRMKTSFNMNHRINLLKRIILIAQSVGKIAAWQKHIVKSIITPMTSVVNSVD